jgi:hypothetical protein
LVNEETQNIALTTNELSILNKLGQFLQNPLTQTRSVSDHQSEFDVVRKIITQWSFNNRFPGINNYKFYFYYYVVTIIIAN